MKILWLDLNSSYAHSSLALPAIHAQMMNDTSAQWQRFSTTINENIGLIICQLLEASPDVIAATNWLFTHEALIQILGRVHALLPQCQIVLGGPEFLGENELFLRTNPFVTAVFRGEGEETFPQWIACHKDMAKWIDVKGLCYIDADAKYQDNGLAKVLAFDKLIAPEESPFFNWEKPFVQLETTRGCFNTCAFCVSGGEKPVRSLSIDVIRERLVRIHAHGIKNVRVLDRTFNYNIRHARALLQLFLEFTPDICFHLEIHPALLSSELQDELCQLPQGLLHLEAGIQSLREPVLEISQRKGRLTDALDGLRFLCTLPQMETHADLIAGLPLYTLADMIEDVHTLASYGADEIQLESLKLLPGTEMRRRAAELGICYSPYPPYEVLQTREISAPQLQVARQLSRMIDGFYNVKAWQMVMRQMMLENSDFLMRFLHHLTTHDWIDQPLSLEKRGLILYDFSKKYYPTYRNAITMAWIEAGLSLKKQPAEKVLTKRQTPPTQWQVIDGEYKESLRLCFLPIGENNDEGYWYGFESEIQQPKPVFKALS